MNAVVPEIPTRDQKEKIDLAGPALAEIVRIVEDGGRRPYRVREPSGLSMVFVAKPEHVRAVLTDEAHFRLAHYAKLYGSIAPPHGRLLMHDADRQRYLRLALLREAVGRTPWFAQDGERLRALATETVQTLLHAFEARPDKTFDVVGEYAYFAPYLIGRRILGLGGPDHAGLFERLVCFAKNLPRGRRFTPETTPYLTQLVWAQLVFAHLFGNFENRRAPLRWIARLCEDRLRAHIRDELARSVGRIDDSVFAALLTLGEGFDPADGPPFEEHVTALMLELMGTMQAVPTMAFTGLLAHWRKPDEDLAARLRDMDPLGAHHFIMESLRITPPATYLLRRAAEGARIDQFPLAEGEYVCALTLSATMDPAATPSPDQLRPRTPADYLHFGPERGPHYCFGHVIGPIILGAMVEGLRSLDGLRAREPMHTILGQGERMRVTFRAITPSPLSGGASG